MYISIKGISLEHFSAPHHSSPLLAPDHVSRHVMFHYLSYDDIKQDVATTDAHSKRIIKLFQNRTVFFYDMITI